MTASSGGSGEIFSTDVSTLFGKSNLRGTDSVPSQFFQRGLGVILNVPTPYHLHLLGRIAREIPEYGLCAIFTRGRPDFPWEIDHSREFQLVNLSSKNEWGRQAWWRHPILDLMKTNNFFKIAKMYNIKAVIISGWDSLAHLSILLGCCHKGIKVFLRGDSNIRNKTSKSFITSMAKQIILPYILNLCDGLMPMGRLGQQYFETYGAKKEKCFWVPYEPDYDLFQNVRGEEICLFRHKLALNESRRYFLYCGRLVPAKRVDLLLSAFERIADQRPEWHLLIAGDGPLQAELKGYLQGRLKDRVTWLGFRQIDELRLLYHCVHVLVIPSDHEPWGLVVNEAMASRLPVVASNAVGSAHELVTDKVNGCIFPAGNEIALAEALLEISEENSLSRYSRNVSQKLATWRKKTNPILGIRQALKAVNLLPILINQY